MIETTLVALLSPLVAGRVYADVARPNTPLPRIVYQQVGGAAIEVVEDEVPSLRNARMQIVAWANTRPVATTLALDIEKLLIEAPTLQARPLGALTAIHEADTQLYGARQDFRIWAAR